MIGKVVVHFTEELQQLLDTDIEWSGSTALARAFSFPSILMHVIQDRRAGRVYNGPAAILELFANERLAEVFPRSTRMSVELDTARNPAKHTILIKASLHGRGRGVPFCVITEQVDDDGYLNRCHIGWPR